MIEREEEHKDLLTGTDSRKKICRNLENEIVNFLNSDIKFTVLLLDLDGFGKFNSKFGKFVGNEILKKSAEKIKKAIRGTDYLGRIEGDKFCVLIKNSSLKEGSIVASRCISVFNKTLIDTEAGEIKISASGGLAEVGKDTPDILTLLEKANAALCLAKKLGKNTMVSVE